jgi:hypothetical protein
VFDGGNTHLVQNNHAIQTSAGANDATSHFNVGGTGTQVWEYNQCTLDSGVGSNRGRCFYVHSTATGTIGRYNFFELKSLCYAQCSRWRDTTGFQITNNFTYSSVANQEGWVIHENAANTMTENHVISNNTFLYVTAVGSDGALWLGYQDGNTVNYNIFEATTNDTGSAAISEGWSGQGAGSSNTVTGNVYYQFARLLDLDLTGYTESSTQNTAPGVSSTTGLSANLNNATYGANLNVSSIPYCKADGTAHSASSLFGMTVTIVGCGAGAPSPRFSPSFLRRVSLEVEP